MEYLYGQTKKEGGSIQRGNVLVTSIQKRRREAKEKAIREIAGLFAKNFGFKDVPTTGDIEKVISGLRKHLPIEGKKSISTDSNVVRSACIKIASRLNEIFGPKFIETDVETNLLCKDISEKLYSLTVSLNGEYFDTLANVAIIVKNLKTVVESARANFEKIKKTIPNYNDLEAFQESAMKVLEQIAQNLNVMVENNRDTNILEELEKNKDINIYFTRYTGQYAPSLGKLFDSTYYTAMLMERARKLAADVGLEIKKIKEIVNSESPGEALGKALNKNLKGLTGKKLTQYVESFNKLRKILTQEISREVFGKGEDDFSGDGKVGGDWKREDNKEPLSLILAKQKKIHKDTVVIFFDVFNAYLSSVNDEIVELLRDAEKGKLNSVDLKSISDALLGVPEITDYSWFYKMVGAFSPDPITDDKDRELALMGFKNLVQRLEGINKSVKNSHLSAAIKYLCDIVDLILQVSKEHASSTRDAIRTGALDLKSLDTRIGAIGEKISGVLRKTGEIVENVGDGVVKAITGKGEKMGASEMLSYMKAKNPADILRKFNQLSRIILLSIKKNEILENFKYVLGKHQKADFDEIKAKQIALVKDRFVELMEVDPVPKLVLFPGVGDAYRGKFWDTSIGMVAGAHQHAPFKKYSVFTKKGAFLYTANTRPHAGGVDHLATVHAGGIMDTIADNVITTPSAADEDPEASKKLCEKFIEYYQKYFDHTVQMLETAEALEIHFNNFINKTLEIGGDFTNILMDFDTDILLKKSSGIRTARCKPFCVVDPAAQLAGANDSAANASGRGPLPAATNSVGLYFSPDYLPAVGGDPYYVADYVPSLSDYEKRFTKAWEICGIKNMISIFARFCGWKENNFMETTFKSPTDIANSILGYMMYRQFICVDTAAAANINSEGYIGGGVALEDHRLQAPLAPGAVAAPTTADPSGIVHSTSNVEIGFNRHNQLRVQSKVDPKNYGFYVTTNEILLNGGASKHLRPFQIPHKFEDTDTLATGTDKEVLVHEKFRDVNRIFNAVLNSMVGKIVVAADTFNMLRGVTLGSYGVKHVFSRMILGGAPESGIKINPKLTEIYARVHLLLKFYIDINKDNYNSASATDVNIIWGLEVAGPFRSLYKALINDIVNTDYTKELVFTCNSLYEKYKDDKDPCLSVMRCISEDFNEKMGFYNADKFRKSIKSSNIQDKNISLVDDNKILRIPGDNITRIAPSRNYTKNVVAAAVEQFGTEIEISYKTAMVAQIRKLMAKVEKGLADVIGDKNAQKLNAILLDEKIKKLGEDIEGAQEPMEVLTKYFQDPTTFVSSDFFRETGDFDVKEQPLKVIYDLVMAFFKNRQQFTQRNMFLDFYRNDYKHITDFVKLDGKYNFYPNYPLGQFRTTKDDDWKNILSNTNLRYLLADSKELIEERKTNAYAVTDFVTKVKDLLSVMHKFYPRFILMLREVYSTKGQVNSYQLLKKKYPENKALIKAILSFEGNVPKELLGQGEGLYNNGRNTVLGRPSGNKFVAENIDQQKALYYQSAPSYIDYVMMEPEIDPVGCLYTLWRGNYGGANKKEFTPITNVTQFARIVAKNLGFKENELPMYPTQPEMAALDLLAAVAGVGGAGAGSAAVYTNTPNVMSVGTGMNAAATSRISVGRANGATNGLLSTNANYFLKAGIKHDTFKWFTSAGPNDQEDAMKGWWSGDVNDLVLYDGAGAGVGGGHTGFLVAQVSLDGAGVGGGVVGVAGGGIGTDDSLEQRTEAATIRYKAWEILSKSLVGVALLYVAAIQGNQIVNGTTHVWVPNQKKHITDATWYRGFLSSVANNPRRVQPANTAARQVWTDFTAANFTATSLSPIGVANGALLADDGGTPGAYSRITWNAPTKQFNLAAAAQPVFTNPAIKDLWTKIADKGLVIAPETYGNTTGDYLAWQTDTGVQAAGAYQFITKAATGAGVDKPLGMASGLTSFVVNMLTDDTNRGRHLSYILQLGSANPRPMNMYEVKEYVKSEYGITITNKDLKISDKVPEDDIYGCVYGGFRLYKIGKDREEVFLPADKTLEFDGKLRNEIFQDYNILYTCQRTVQAFNDTNTYYTKFAARMEFMERWLTWPRAKHRLNTPKEMLTRLQVEELAVKNKMYDWKTGGGPVDAHLPGGTLGYEIMSEQTVDFTSTDKTSIAGLITADLLSFAFRTIAVLNPGPTGNRDAVGTAIASTAPYNAKEAFNILDDGPNTFLMRLIPVSKKVDLIASYVDTANLSYHFTSGGLNYFYGMFLSRFPQYPQTEKDKIEKIRKEVLGAFEQKLVESSGVLPKYEEKMPGGGISAYEALRQFIIYAQQDKDMGVQAALVNLASTDYKTKFPDNKLIDVYELIYDLVPKSLAELRVSGNNISVNFGPFNKMWGPLLGAFGAKEEDYIQLQKILAEHPEIKIDGTKATFYTVADGVLPDDALAGTYIYRDQDITKQITHYFKDFKLADLRKQFTSICTDFIKKTSDNKTTITQAAAISVTKYRTFYHKIIDPILSNDFIYNYDGVIYPYLDRTLYKIIKESAQKNPKDTKGGSRANVEDSYELLLDTVKIKIRSNIYRFNAEFKDFYKKLNFFKSLIFEFNIKDVDEAIDGIQRMMNQCTTFMRVIEEVILEINETPKAGELMKNYFSNYEKLNGSQPFVPYGSIFGFAHKILESNKHSDMGYAARAYFYPGAKINSFATVKREIEALEKTKIVKYNIKPEQFLDFTLDAYVDYYLRIKNMFGLTDGVSDLVKKTDPDYFVVEARNRYNAIDQDTHKNYKDLVAWVPGNSVTAPPRNFETQINHVNSDKYSEQNILSVIQENNMKYAMKRFISITVDREADYARVDDIYLNLMEKNFVPINFMNLYRSAAFSGIMIFDTVFRFWVDSAPLTIIDGAGLTAPYDRPAAGTVEEYTGQVDRYNGYAVWMSPGFLDRNLYSILAYSVASKTGYVHGLFGLPQFGASDPGTEFVGPRVDEEPMKTGFHTGITFL
jgi:hypothetical protein